MKNEKIIINIERNVEQLFNNENFKEVVQNCLILLDLEKNNKIGIKYLELSKFKLGGKDNWDKAFDSISDFFDITEFISDVMNSVGNLFSGKENNKILDSTLEVVIKTSETTGEIIVYVGETVVEIGAGTLDILGSIVDF